MSSRLRLDRAGRPRAPRRSRCRPPGRPRCRQPEAGFRLRHLQGGVHLQGQRRFHDLADRGPVENQRRPLLIADPSAPSIHFLITADPVFDINVDFTGTVTCELADAHFLQAHILSRLRLA